MTFSEIGAELGLSPQATFDLYRAAIRKLRRRFGSDPQFLMFIHMIRSKETHTEAAITYPKGRARQTCQ